MMLYLNFSLLIAGCAVSNVSPSPSSQEAKIRLELNTLQDRAQLLYEQAHQLESEIDEVRRRSSPHSAVAIQKLEQQIKQIRSDQDQLQADVMAWKRQLIPENSGK